MTKQKTSDNNASQKTFRYGYFYKQSNGSLISAGNDNSLLPDIYKVGDINIGRPGKVIEIRTGEQAKQLSCDVAVIWMRTLTNTARVS